MCVLFKCFFSLLLEFSSCNRLSMIWCLFITESQLRKRRNIANDVAVGDQKNLFVVVSERWHIGCKWIVPAIVLQFKRLTSHASKWVSQLIGVRVNRLMQLGQLVPSSVWHLHAKNSLFKPCYGLMMNSRRALWLMTEVSLSRMPEIYITSFENLLVSSFVRNTLGSFSSW